MLRYSEKFCSAPCQLKKYIIPTIYKKKILVKSSEFLKLVSRLSERTLISPNDLNIPKYKQKYNSYLQPKPSESQ